MIIYEVNLLISPEILDEYTSWLNEHITTMLTFDGFHRAHVHSVDKQDDQIKITVHYEVESNEKLDEYFKNYAPKMRQEGIDKFGDKFSANRRILEQCSKFLQSH